MRTWLYDGTHLQMELGHECDFFYSLFHNVGDDAVLDPLQRIRG